MNTPHRCVQFGWSTSPYRSAIHRLLTSATRWQHNLWNSFPAFGAVVRIIFCNATLSRAFIQSLERSLLSSNGNSSAAPPSSVSARSLPLALNVDAIGRQPSAIIFREEHCRAVPAPAEPTLSACAAWTAAAVLLRKSVIGWSAHYEALAFGAPAEQPFAEGAERRICSQNSLAKTKGLGAGSPRGEEGTDNRTGW